MPNVAYTKAVVEETVKVYGGSARVYRQALHTYFMVGPNFFISMYSVISTVF